MKVILWKRVILLVAAIVIALVTVALIVNRTNSGQSETVTTTKVVKLTPAQVQAKKKRSARVAARLAAQAKREAAAQAAQAKRQAAQAKREAAAQARLDAAANAWHAGYSQDPTDPAVYWKWVPTTSCSAGGDWCWHIQVIAESGCSSLFVEGAELQGGTNIGDLIDDRNNVAPKEPVLLEWDTFGHAGTKAKLTAITCNP